MKEGGHAPARRDDPDVADALLHPVALLALGLLLLNDHVLKAAWPGAVTGKLSDLAGLAFFPILLLSAGELARAFGRRWRRPTVRALVIAIAVTTAGFTLIKTVPSAAEASGWLLGLAQWLLSLPIRALVGLPLPPVAPAIVVADPTDLVALPGVTLAIWVGMSRLRKVGNARRAATAGRPAQ
jgi:hypothetical protein